MKNFLLLLLLYSFFLICNSCVPPPVESGAEEISVEAPEPVSEEEQAINRAIVNAYSSISFEKGSQPDFEAVQAIFTPDAMFYNFRNDSLQAYSFPEFVGGFKAFIESGEITSFKEVELGGETEYFGRVGHRISAYGSYFNGAEEPEERGVNSFQVLKMDGKWRVSAVIWDVEKKGQLIPGKYLSGE